MSDRYDSGAVPPPIGGAPSEQPGDGGIANMPDETIVEHYDTQGIEKGESIYTIYLRRFRKHTLGRIGLAILLVLYFIVIFADFLSPYDMTYGDNRKPFHPPSSINWMYTNPDGTTEFRPFVWEYLQTDIARRTYRVVPQHTIRAVTVPLQPGRRQYRFVAIASDRQARQDQIVSEVQTQYRIPAGDERLDRLAAAIRSLESGDEVDRVVEFTLDTVTLDDEERDRVIYLARGNKNFVGLFNEGTPYTFMGMFDTRRHFFTSPTSGYYPLGADRNGRDLLSRLIHGSRVSMTVGLIGAAITFTLGLTFGGIAGYAGGKVDNLIMRLCEVIIAFPGLYLLLTLRAAFPSNLDSIQVYFLIVVATAFIACASFARIIRGLVLSIKTQDFVMSARTLGLSHWKIIRKHVLPNTFSYSIVQVTLLIPSFILGEAALSLLGLGIVEPQASWGNMLSVARNYRVVRDFPWILWPGFLIFIAILAWNFFGDGIRDAVDPRSKH